MTAPEPTPTAEHTDAAARAMNPPTFRAGPVDGPRASAQKVIRARAESLLASTDPAVHAAMLDALVRAGVLTEEWTVRHSQGVHPGPFTEKAAREWIASDVKRDAGRQFSAQGKQALLRRAVTRWEVAP